MESNHADYLSMILSADWFAPHWSTLQLSIDQEKGNCIRKACGKIVEDMISDASEYHHVDFSEERVERTRSDLLSALQACDVGPAIAERMNTLIMREHTSGIDDATTWLVVILTGMLLRNSLPEGGEPDLVVRTTISRIGKHCELVRETEWDNICLSSATEWDEYLRRLTPEQPTMLADRLSSILTRDNFERLWSDIHARLGKEERAAVVKWYRRAARALTRDELRIPVDS